MKHQPNAKVIEREPDGSVSYVLPVTPVAKWGRDHWTTLLYIESRCVDAKGVLDNQKMRTNARVHRKLLGDLQARTGMTGEDYPTELRNGDTIDRHDDWSCVEEMVAHGLLVIVSEKDKTGEPFGGGEIRLRLTDLGWRTAHRIRRDRAEGTPTVRWEPPAELEAEIAAQLPREP